MVLFLLGVSAPLLQLLATVGLPMVLLFFKCSSWATSQACVWLRTCLECPNVAIALAHQSQVNQTSLRQNVVTQLLLVNCAPVIASFSCATGCGIVCFYAQARGLDAHPCAPPSCAR